MIRSSANGWSNCWSNRAAAAAVSKCEHKYRMGGKHKIQNTKYKIQNTRCKIQNTKYSSSSSEHMWTQVCDEEIIVSWWHWFTRCYLTNILSSFSSKASSSSTYSSLVFFVSLFITVIIYIIYVFFYQSIVCTNNIVTSLMIFSQKTLPRQPNNFRWCN